MFQARTVLILGAGASAEVGLPVGAGLLKKICDIINVSFEFGSRQTRGDAVFVDALGRCMGNDPKLEKINDHLSVTERILAAAVQAISIDNLIDSLEDKRIELIAKLAIVRAIQAAEGESNFFSRSKDGSNLLDLSRFSNTWYDSLTKILCERRKVSDIAKIFENISIISFNYDRCIEEYLSHSIANYYGLLIENARELVSGLKIHRPYGIAGNLALFGRDRRISDFGKSDAQRLADSVPLIRTFTQGVENPKTLQAMRLDLADADRVIFLGFAFHAQNMELLQCDARPDLEVFATAYGISASDKSAIAESIATHFGERSRGPDRILVTGDTCRDFFVNYWRSVAAPRKTSYEAKTQII